jgi:hypothetical protein
MPLVRNLEKLSGCQRIDDLAQSQPGALVEIARRIDQELPAWTGVTLQDFCDDRHRRARGDARGAPDRRRRAAPRQGLRATLLDEGFAL